METKSEVIQVGELSVGFSENALVETADLSGKCLGLFFDDKTGIEIEFKDHVTLTRKVIDKKTAGRAYQEGYRATNPRKGVYFVDYVIKRKRASTECLILDFNSGIATVLQGELPGEKAAKMNKLERVAKGLHQTAVNVDFKHASIDKPFKASTPRHQITDELLGKRIKYVYSAKDAYEHIYLNPYTYTWHCLAGIEKGLADTDLCHYYKIGEELYLFVWREKLVPTIGVVVIDLKTMKTTGKIFGYESDDFGALSNFPVGAYAQFGSITSYD